MRGGTENIVGIVKSPVETYRNLLHGEAKLCIPFVIVVISGLVKGLFTSLQLEACSLSSVIAKGVIVAILAWICIAGIIHLILKALGSEGSYKRFLELTGYIYVISVFGSVTGNIATMYTNTLLATPIYAIFTFWWVWLYVLAVRETYQRREVQEKQIFNECTRIGNGPIIVTFAVFIFLLYNSMNQLMCFSVTAMMYFIWWGIITSSYGSWHDKKALLWLSVPVIVVLLYLYNYNIINIIFYLYKHFIFIGLIWLGLALFAYSYYIWCCYHLSRAIPTIRLDILSLITIAFYIFMIEIPMEYDHFVITLLFPLWWLALTVSYKTWYRISTWIWACIALSMILLVPFTFMFMTLNSLYPYPTVISIFFAVLFAYSASYYMIIKWGTVREEAKRTS